MNDQQIYELMATKPQIRAVQICDALDEDLSNVSAALRVLVECGDVVQSKGTSPAGTPTMVYDLSATFKASKEYRALMALMLSAAANKEPVVVARPIAPVEPPAESRIDLAVAYLTKHGAVDENELRAAIGLKDGSYPVAYLTRAIKTGMLHKRRDGKWALGSVEVVASAVKPKAKPAPKPFTAVRPKVGPVAQFSETEQPGDAPVIDKPTAKPAPIVDQTAPRSLRCGLWSDGTVELQRDGCTVAAMAQCDAEFIAAFLARVRAPAAN